MATVYLKQHSVISVSGGSMADIVIYPFAYSGGYSRAKQTGKVAVR